jgi:hypothetical protein
MKKELFAAQNILPNILKTPSSQMRACTMLRSINRFSGLNLGVGVLHAPELKYVPP